MAPAGDFVSLSAAIQAGADAVYFGVKGANMRAGAKNFEISEISKLCKACHEKNIRAYLVLNTIYFDYEAAFLKKILSAAKKAKVDAVIAWDFSVINLANKAGLPVHLSTQASVANAGAILSYYENFNIKRFVLARECTLENFADIKKALQKKLGSAKAREISLEVFAHGAMCVSVSGRCFMSLFSQNKSANRGECTQPCRRSYSIIDDGGLNTSFKLDCQRVLSPKDLCTLPFIDKLIEANVDSLKIEGRGRNAEYVFETVSAYRKAVDFYFENFKKKNFKTDFEKLKSELTLKLENVFNRGFSSGFFMGRPLGDWTSSGNMAKSKKTILGHVTKFYPKLSVAEISLDNAPLKVGEEIQIESDKTGFLRFKVESMQIKGASISSANKKDIVAIKTPDTVRKMDRIFTF